MKRKGAKQCSLKEGETGGGMDIVGRLEEGLHRQRAREQKKGRDIVAAGGGGGDGGGGG